MASEYEKLRNSKLASNHAKMVELGLTGKASAAAKKKPPQPEKRLFSQLSASHPCNKEFPITDKVNTCNDNEMEACIAKFPMIWAMMKSGHSVLLQGLGSKAYLLHLFATEYAAERCDDLFMIPGYGSKTFDLHRFLDELLDRYGVSKCERNTDIKLETIAARCKETDRTVVCIIPSLDGECLRHTHDVFSTLIKTCNGSILFLASADHVRSSALLNSRYGFVCIEVHTRLPYLLETKRYSNARVANKSVHGDTTNGVVVQQSSKANHNSLVSLQSLEYVLKCVPQTHVKVFKELAKHGKMPFDDLFEFCRTRLMFANSKSRLDQLIKEFIDQNVVVRKNIDGVDTLLVNCSKETIDVILK